MCEDHKDIARALSVWKGFTKDSRPEVSFRAKGKRTINSFFKRAAAKPKQGAEEQEAAAPEGGNSRKRESVFGGSSHEGLPEATRLRTISQPESCQPSESDVTASVTGTAAAPTGVGVGGSAAGLAVQRTALELSFPFFLKLLSNSSS